VQKFLIVFSDPGPAREFAKRNSYELPADYSVRIKTYSIVNCHSLNRVVFNVSDFRFCTLTTKCQLEYSLPSAAILQCCHVIRRGKHRIL